MPNPEVVAGRLVDALSHRGPDSSGVARLTDADNVVRGALGHTRLAVIDTTERGNQPMADPRTGKVIAYNGEIYNHVELREHLARAGWQFRGESDTETLLSMWVTHGPACLERVRGMYAFAVWDPGERALTLTRDRLGIKPLYYWTDGHAFAFASEVRALIRARVVRATLSQNGVESFLTWGAVAEPDTIIEDVRALEAGTALVVRAAEGRLLVSQEAGQPSPGSLDGHAGDRARAPIRERLKSALIESVSEHLIADVPVAVFLSSGVDSAAVAAAAVAAGRRPSTFTVSLGSPDHDEAPRAAKIARHLGVPHEAVVVSGADALAAVPDALAAMDQPTIDGLNTYFLSKSVRERQFKVALSGLGGDELFGGYPSFRRAQVLARAGGMHRRAGTLVRGHSPRQRKMLAASGIPDPAAAAYVASRLLYSPVDVAQASLKPTGLRTAQPPRIPAGSWSVLDRVTFFELGGYTKNMLLRDTDAFSMAHGLEVRVPFLASQVVSAALSVPASTRGVAARYKPLLRSVVSDWLPPELVNTGKRGFGLPMRDWMNDHLIGEVQSAMDPDLCSVAGLRFEFVRSVWDRHGRRRRTHHWARLWALYVLIRWAERWIDSGGERTR